MHRSLKPCLCTGVKTDYVLPFLSTLTKSPMATTDCHLNSSSNTPMWTTFSPHTLLTVGVVLTCVTGAPGTPLGIWGSPGPPGGPLASAPQTAAQSCPWAQQRGCCLHRRSQINLLIAQGEQDLQSSLSFPNSFSLKAFLSSVLCREREKNIVAHQSFDWFPNLLMIL